MKNQFFNSSVIPVTGAFIKPRLLKTYENLRKAAEKFLDSAYSAEPGTGLALRLSLKQECGGPCMVLGNAGADQDDYSWIFGSFADCSGMGPADLEQGAGEGAFSYIFTGEDEKDSFYNERYLDDLFSALCAAGAILEIRAIRSKEEGIECSAFMILDRPASLTVRTILGRHLLHMEPVPFLPGKEREKEAGRIPLSASGKMIRLILDMAWQKEFKAGMQDPADVDNEDVEDEYISDPLPDTVCMEEWSGSIEDMEFSVRTFNSLKRAGYHTYDEIRDLTDEELGRIRNLGRKSVEEIRKKVEEYRFRPVRKAEDPEKKDYVSMLEGLTGLAGVKKQVRRVCALSLLKKDMKEKGKGSIPVSLNMCFVGNPGTAKTTAARILAGLLYEADILKSPDILEAGRADLVGRYVGETAQKVRTVFSAAEGRLLFVDEAYSLLDMNEGSYGDEAINTLVQEMENRRDSTVVVFAGYPDRMEDFFSRNPGLRSRIPFLIPFEDYGIEELLAITSAEAEKRGFSLSGEAGEKVREICLSAMKERDFGNGRFCRNLVENAVLSYAERNYGVRGRSVEDFMLTGEDFSAPVQGKKEASRRIGFY